MIAENISKTLEPEVASYQKVASLGGWAGGGRTLWAIGFLGLIAGGAIGAVAPFFPLIVQASTLSAAAAAVPTSMAVLGSIGMMMGFSGGLVLGRISGAAASVGEEQELRMKRWTTKMLQQINPNVAMINEKEVEISPGNPLEEQLKESYYTYINPRIGATMAVVGAGAGVVLAGAHIATGGSYGPIVSNLSAMTGMGAEAFTAEAIVKAPAAFIAYTVGVTASFGALFSLNFPKITSELTEFSGKLIGGKIIGREWGPPAKQPEQQQQVQPEQTAVSSENTATVQVEHAETPTKRFTQTVDRNALGFEQMLVDKKSTTTRIQIQ